MAVARVLLVEPNDHLRRVFRRRFVREGFELIEAVDGEGALGVARRGLPDVIVVEGSVRDAGGLDLPVRLARDPELCDVPLIVLEARGRWGFTIHRSDDAEAAVRGEIHLEAAHREKARQDTTRRGMAGGDAGDRLGRPESASSPAALDGPLLRPLFSELRHPFRPGRLVELAKGVIASGADATVGG